MRIAHVISGLVSKSGGTTTAVIDMLRWQAILGENVSLITGIASDTDVSTNALTDAGVSVLEFSTIGPKVLRYQPNLKSYLKEDGEKFDLFVIHGSYQYPAYATSRRCKEAGVPYIFVPHGSLDPAVRAKHRGRNRVIDFVYHDDVIRPAAAWHFTSEREQARCERKLWRHAFVEPLGFDLTSVPKTFVPGRFRQRYKIPITATIFVPFTHYPQKRDRSAA